jgi:hypothetical protein
MTTKIRVESPLLYWSAELLVVLLCIWALLPLLTMGLVGDDAYNSQIRGAAILQNFSLSGDILAQIKGWWIGAGRLNGFSWLYTKLIFWHVDSVFIIKALGLTIMIMSVLTFGRIIRKLTNNELYAFLCMICCPVLFQFRAWHDPILSFLFLIPLVTLLMHLSIISLINYAETSKQLWWALSLTLFVIALFTYELAYFYLLIFIAMFMMYQRLRENSRTLYYLVAIALVHAIVAKLGPLLLLPEGQNVTYPGAQPRFVYPETLIAYWFQVTGAFPLSWKLSNGASGMFPLRTTIVAALFIYSSIFLVFLSNFSTNAKVSRIKLCLVIAGILILGFPMLSAISGHAKDIVSLGFGYSYIPVYAQLFGIAIVIGTLLHYGYQKTRFGRRSTSWAIAFLFAFVATVTFNSNKKIVDSTAFAYNYAPKAIENLVKSGFFDDWDASHSYLIQSYRTPFDNAMHFSKLLEKPVHACYVHEETQYSDCIKKHNNANRIPYVFNYTLTKTGELSSSVLCEVDYESVRHGIYGGFYGRKKCKVRQYNSYGSVFLNELNLQRLLLLPQAIDSIDLLQTSNKDEKQRERLILVGAHRPEVSGEVLSAWVSQEVRVELNSPGTDTSFKELCFTLIRPATSAALFEISTSSNYGQSFQLSGEKHLCIPFSSSNVVSWAKIKAKGDAVNTDPRDIRFGIAQWYAR